MKVILLRDVKGIGRRFEETEVNDGHANNFLIPRKLAVPSGSSAAAQVKALREQEEAAHQKADAATAQTLSKVAGTTISIKLKADEKGHLFEKLTAAKIAELSGLPQKNIELAEPIKEIGTFDVPISLGEGKRSGFKLEVVRA